MLLYFHITRQPLGGQHAISGIEMLLNVIHKMPLVKVFGCREAALMPAFHTMLSDMD